jgi:hypothetical protein
VQKYNTSKIWVRIDFHNLNKVTPKDEYYMPIADMLINNASGHQLISFLYGNAGYNQVFMAEEDMSKMVFRCPGFIGLFEWVVMTCGLKNAGATYQRVMNIILDDLLGIIIEIYINDVIVKLDNMDSYLADLRLALERMHQYGLKTNLLKYAFGKFLGKLNYLSQFLFNLSEKISAFDPILWLKNEAECTWGAAQQRAFDDIKKYLSSLSVIKAPMVGIPFQLYIATEDAIIWAVLMQVMEGKENIITYLSQRLIDAETRYYFIEKLCLSLFYACSNL